MSVRVFWASSGAQAARYVGIKKAPRALDCLAGDEEVARKSNQKLKLNLGPIELRSAPEWPALTT
jgi:hypothetical protein